MYLVETLEESAMTGNDRARERLDALPLGTPPAIAWALTLSMAAIVVVSGLYVVSPPPLVAPIVPFDLGAARAGAASAGTAINWIAPLGMAADPVGAAAAFAVAFYALRDNRGSEGIGWLLIGSSSLLFTVIDSMAGAVLPVLGRSAAIEGFIVAKHLFDALFVAGSLCLSVGLLYVGLAYIGKRDAGAVWLAWAIAGDGVVGLGSAVAVLAGYDLALSLGGSVGVGAILLMVVGIRVVMTGRAVG